LGGLFRSGGFATYTTQATQATASKLFSLANIKKEDYDEISDYYYNLPFDFFNIRSI
jgi:hypothetical protein